VGDMTGKQIVNTLIGKGSDPAINILTAKNCIILDIQRMSMNAGKKEYKCFIVDDNGIDRHTTASFVRKYSFIKIAGLFETADAALEAAEKEMPDALFLDIDMPELSGLDLRAQLEKVPACIFITAYPEYALQSFDFDALDFIVKPIKPDRFDTSMNRLQYFLDMHYKAELLDHSLNKESLFIKDGHDRIRIQFYDIIYLEALKDYTGIITETKKYCVLTPLGNLLKEKAFQSFIRIHRSYAVQKQYIRKVTPKAVMVNNILLPVGRSYKENLENLINPDA
jgi:two-component system LytT family response regulator